MQNFIVSLEDARQVLSKEIVLHGARTKTIDNYSTVELVNISVSIDNPTHIICADDDLNKLAVTFIKQLQLITGEIYYDLLSKYSSRYYELFRSESTYDGAYGDQISAKIIDTISLCAGRRGVLQIDSYDKIIPSTNLFHILKRGDTLYVSSYNRSVDIYNCMETDLCMYLYLSKVIQSCLAAEKLIYTHIIGSAHVYERDYDDALSHDYNCRIIKHLPIIGDINSNINAAKLAIHNLRNGISVTPNEYHSYIVNLLLTD